MRVIFVSGPYRGNVEPNIIKARRVAVMLWQQGWAVFCPHTNTANFDGECPDDVWLKGDIEILKRCDAIYMMSTWRESKGSQEEYRIARELGKEIIFQNPL